MLDGQTYFVPNSSEGCANGLVLVKKGKVYAMKTYGGVAV
jgi:hypothetical protein